MYSYLKKTYDILPKQYLTLLKYLPYSVLFGKSYNLWKDNVSFDESLLQLKLFNLMTYVQKNTLYGNEEFKSKIYLDEVFSYYDDLRFLSSDDLSDNIDYYTSKNFSSINSYFTTTGGTSRKITSILLSNESYGAEWAHGHHMFDYAKYNMRNDIKLSLRGKKLSGNKIIDFNPIHNEVTIDTFSMNKNNFVILFNKLKKYNIQYIHGYPSLVKEFINYMNLYKFKMNLKGVFLNSEGVSVEEKRMISIFFNSKVISWYGLSEKVLLAIDSNITNKFKVYTSYGFPTIYNPDNHGFGEIVGSTFVNLALPLVKYRTGDFGLIERSNEELFLSNISGRWGKDFIYLNNDKKVPSSSINLHGEVQRYIEFYQIYQNRCNEIVIKILPKQNISMKKDKLLKLFSYEIDKKLPECRIEYKLVANEKELYRTNRGKMPLLVQELE